MNFTWCSPGIHLVFTWHFSDHQTITWLSPDPYLALISSFKLKKSLVVVVGGGWWINPLQTLPQGLVFTFYFWLWLWLWLWLWPWPWAWQFVVTLWTCSGVKSHNSGQHFYQAICYFDHWHCQISKLNQKMDGGTTWNGPIKTRRSHSKKILNKNNNIDPTKRLGFSFIHYNIFISDTFLCPLSPCDCNLWQVF